MKSDQLRLTAIGALALGALAVLPARATSQIIVGIIRGDQTGQKPPLNWVVQISANANGGKPKESVSQQEIYAVAADSVQSLTLIFAARGYQSVEKTVTADGGTKRYDVDLKASLLDAGGKADGNLPPEQAEAIARELENEAQLMLKAGPAQLDVFQWNLMRYEAAGIGNARVKRAVDEVKRNPRYESVVRERSATTTKAYRELQRYQRDSNAAVDHTNLLNLIRDDSQLPDVRSEAIEMLSSPRAPAAIKTQLLQYIRPRFKAEQSSVLIPSYAGALARLGTPVDRGTLEGELVAVDPSRAVASAAALGNARVAAASGALAGAAAKSGNAAVRATSVEALSALDVSGALNAAVAQLAGDPSADVRLHAVRLLDRLTNPATMPENVKRALEKAAASDVSADVRQESQHALGRG